MKRTIAGLGIYLFLCLALSAQEKLGIYSVAFYNLENLFDTEDDPLTDDKEFTPRGTRRWTETKYRKKLKNMAFVISRLAREHCPAGPAVLGVTEIENRKVLEDLIATAEIADMGLEIIHYDSPDKRGVDVALLYNPKLFVVGSSRTYPYIMPNDTAFKTRDVLLASGTLAGEPLHVLVNHWPSRMGNRSSDKREFAAAINKHIADSIYAADPSAHVVIMGDMNDDPSDVSCRVVLNAKKRPEEVGPGGLFNTMWGFFDKGIGTLSYKGRWNLFDQIIISQSLLGHNRSRLTFWKAEIFSRDFLILNEGKNKGYPHRTFSEGKFINGYSDHFPVINYWVKKIEK